jgi:hypothetical protein
MVNAKTPAKKRANHYGHHLKILGTFADVVKVSMTNPDKPKERL